MKIARTKFLIFEIRLREWKHRAAERMWTVIAWNMPDRLVYWTIIRAAVKDEMGHPGYVNAITMLKRFEGNDGDKEIQSEARG